MKKILTIGALVISMVVSASAWVGIDWQPGWGVYNFDSPDVVNFDTGNSLLANSGAIWQLIYAGADDAMDPFSTSEGGAGIEDNYVTGDDVVWGERIVAMGGGTAGDGTDWDTWLLWQGSGDSTYENPSWSKAGFVYQRIFEGLVVTADALNYTSPLFAYNPNWWDGTGVKPTAEMMYTETGSSVTPTAGVQPVPEPATMGLLGLGALVMAIRRRRS